MLVTGLAALNLVCLAVIGLVYFMTRPLPSADGRPSPKRAPSRVALFFVPAVLAMAGVDAALWATSRAPGPPPDGYCAGALRCCTKLHGQANCALAKDADCKAAYERWVENAKDMLETCD